MSRLFLEMVTPEKSKVDPPLFYTSHSSHTVCLSHLLSHLLPLLCLFPPLFLIFCFSFSFFTTLFLLLSYTSPLSPIFLRIPFSSFFLLVSCFLSPSSRLSVCPEFAHVSPLSTLSSPLHFAPSLFSSILSPPLCLSFSFSKSSSSCLPPVLLYTSSSLLFLLFIFLLSSSSSHFSIYE